MIHSKPAQTDHSIHPLIANRWSSLSFSGHPLESEQVDRLLEAARWAPSSYNEQPWFYVVGHKGDEIYEQLEQCLLEGNSWAKTAPVLMLSVAKTFFEHKHKPNRHHMHDVGAANTLMALQATEMELHFHQMAGFESEKARDFFTISADYTPVTMIAIGYPGDGVVPDLEERENSPRERKAIADMIWKS